MRPTLQDLVEDDVEYENLHDHYEYGRSLIEGKLGAWITPGEFIGDGRWSTNGLAPSVRFKDEMINEHGSAWNMWLAAPDAERLLAEHQVRLYEARNRN